ncbi:MAG: hypothetical protein ACRD32_04860 [Nitrososphaerales archaeon]
MKSNSKITFYGGIHEIGGNKFLIEDKGTRVFLDFGMQMGLANYYFAEFLQPRNLNGMADLFDIRSITEWNPINGTKSDAAIQYRDGCSSYAYREALWLSSKH